MADHRLRAFAATMLFTSACEPTGRAELHPAPAAADATVVRVAPATDAPSVAALPDVVAVPTDVVPAPIENPMRFVEHRHGHPELVHCPGALPCVGDGDYATFVTARDWNDYDIIDHGNPQLPIASGSPSSAELWRRVEAAVVATLRGRGVTRFQLESDLADKMPQLHRLPVRDGHLLGHVPPRTSAAAPPPSAVAPSDANASLHQVLGRLGERTFDFFDATELARMTADTFNDPQLDLVSSYVSRGDVGGNWRSHVESIAVVYSRESRRVYVVGHAVDSTGGHTDFPGFARDAETAIIDALQRLGIARIAIPLSQIDRLPRLSGVGAWVDGHLPP